MNITRRGFLKLIGFAIASGAVVPAFAKQREPYVIEGESVDWIGHSPGGFIGGQLVAQVEQFDGVGYPVRCWTNSFGRHKRIERYYDFDLSNFRRDVPAGFWSLPGSKKYPNVHTWVRVQRFGETVEEAMKQLNFVSLRP